MSGMLTVRAMNLPLRQAKYHVNQHCLQNYGFVSNPILPIHNNFKEALSTKKTPLFLQPTSLSFHNLCINNKLPPGSKELLGLNLKYCLATYNMHFNTNLTIQKMAYTIRTKYYLKELGIPDGQDYEKQIYMKNKYWNPPPAPLTFKNKITEFEKEIKHKQQLLATKNQK